MASIPSLEALALVGGGRVAWELVIVFVLRVADKEIKNQVLILVVIEFLLLTP